MTSWKLIGLGLSCAFILGCRTDPNIPILERELRLQEDKIYELQNCVEDHKVALDSCRRENETLRKQLVGGAAPGGFPSPPTAEPRVPGRPGPALPEGLAPPSVEVPSEGKENVPESLRPSRKRGDSGSPQEMNVPAVPESLKGPTKQQPPGARSERTAPPGPTVEVSADSTPVQQISLASGSARRSRGDEGIVAVIEPRDAHGALVCAAAPLSVVILDPALTGPAARVARWDFSAEQVAGMYRRTSLGEGIHLDMPWPAGPPAHPDVQMHVRYTTADGRKVETSEAIRMELGGRPAHEWVAASPRPRPDRIDSAVQPWRSEPPAAGQELLPPQALRSARQPSAPASEGAAPNRPVWSPDRL